LRLPNILYALDWGSGQHNGYIELGRSNKFNPMGGMAAVPLGEARFWLFGAFGPVMMKVK
jgi:hypothetical protein